MSRILSEVLDQIAPAALVDVFASYGARFKEQAALVAVKDASIVPRGRTGGPVVAGVVGFSGDTMRGTLLLATSFEVIANARPSELKERPLSTESASDWIVVRDWTGELANQVLGRIKNRLHRFGVTFDVAPPAALSGPALTFAAPKGPAPKSYIFAAGSDQIWYCFDAIIDPGLRVAAEGAEAEPTEGKTILFE